MSDRLAAARRTLQAANQVHVLHYWDNLDPQQRSALLDQIESVDWPEVTRLVESHVLNKPQFELPQNVQPAPWYPYTPTDALRPKYAAAKQAGIDLIRQGKVAAFTVAGGQGTRLGWDAPKGTFPATPIRKLPLFACLAQSIQKTQQKYSAAVPWYVMTSPANDDATRRFFQQNNHFGLDPANIMIFPQAMMPAFDVRTGMVLLESAAGLALSPNGHGGSLKALHASGALADMKKRGIEQISYVQIDNPIVLVIDPLFIGLHALDHAQMSSKMLPKREPLEKLGNFCLVDGRITVIEYSDLPETLAHERLPTGGLRFRAGSIALHVLQLAFVQSLNAAGSFGLPFHRAEKKVPFLDPATGKAVKPEKPNAVKLETFVFDALPLCDKSIIYETDRIEEFAPIKNADTPGAADSPQTSKDIQTERAARWLEKAGVKIPRDPSGKPTAVLEISALTAIEPDDLKSAKLPSQITPGSQLLL